MTVMPSRRLVRFLNVRTALAAMTLAFALLAGGAALPARAATLLQTLEAPSATPVEHVRHRRHYRHHHHRVRRHHYVRRPLYCQNDFVRLCGPYTCKIDPRRYCTRY